MRKDFIEDSLLKFFYKLIDDKRERKILELIFKNVDEEKIIEELIDFKSEEVKDAKI